ncbi:hypothetical protein HELRODRAFT_183644 [Helobdella robusta]|uniref:Neurotransmitter-gated ion-channel ligand-binding domain-containing protein n=1 Tax=Helobdella robusta TaxID=6412 RepID=T1FJZ5_HELRO|nr:hypothetical protein HELRODRAFT_183644 [Helobdella robusta]ESO10422.1 hypothetical protein HELRODRAFT_183644 [Helobdella robusta]
MFRSWVIFVCGLILVAFPAITEADLCNGNATKSAEQNLLRCLRSRGDNTFPPITKKNGYRVPTVVQVDPTGYIIMNVNDKENFIEASLYLDLIWTDTRLSWEPTLYNGIKEVLLPARNMWFPEPNFYLGGVSSGKTVVKGRGIHTYRAKVNYNGTVQWPLYIEYQGHCLVDFTTFPEDSQNCEAKMFFHPDDETQVTYNVSKDLFALSMAPEWKYLVFSTGTKERYSLRFVTNMSRRSLIYRQSLIIPLILIAILCLLMFWASESCPYLVIIITIITLRCLVLEMVFLSFLIVVSIFTYLAYHHDPRNPLPGLVRTVRLLLNPFIKMLTFVGGTSPADTQQLPTHAENNYNAAAAASIATTTTAKPFKSAVDQTLLSLYEYFSEMRESKFEPETSQLLNNEWKQVAVVSERLLFYCAVAAFFIVSVVVPIEVFEHQFDLAGDY